MQKQLVNSCGTQGMRNVVIVSPYFPPSSLAGVHRARHLAKHLPANGWHPIVLCVDEAYYEEPLDLSLASLVPKEAEVVKVRALSARLTRPFGVGEISLRAWQSLRRSLFQILSTQPIQCVLITGSPFYPMLMAATIRKQFGVPVILDFQDPWVSVRGATQPTLSKGGISHRLARLLEPRVLRAANAITSVSEIQNLELVRRYPKLAEIPMAGIPIGCDPEDFVGLDGSLPSRATRERPYVELSYVGTFWARAAGPVTTLFRAFKLLREAEPTLASRLRLRFVGTGGGIGPLAAAEGISDAIVEVPRRIPYLDALRVMANSDGLLIIGSDQPHYTASKIYPALMSGRPFLSLFHAESSAHGVLCAAGGGHAHSFSSADDLVALEASLAASLRTFALGPELLGKVNPRCYEPYEALSIAKRFADVFEGVVVRRAM